jgi:hypothetical protein
MNCSVMSPAGFAMCAAEGSSEASAEGWFVKHQEPPAAGQSLVIVTSIISRRSWRTLDKREQSTAEAALCMTNGDHSASAHPQTGRYGRRMTLQRPTLPRCAETRLAAIPHA